MLAVPPEEERIEQEIVLALHNEQLHQADVRILDFSQLQYQILDGSRVDYNHDSSLEAVELSPEKNLYKRL